MKTIFMAIFAIVLSLPALAEPVNSRDYTCEELQNLVEEEGVVEVDVFLGHITVYSDTNSCEFRERAILARFRTSDERRCITGYRCVFAPINH